MGGLIEDLINMSDNNERMLNRKINKLRKKNPELVPTYVRFGKESIILAITCFIFIGLSPLITFGCFTYGFSYLGAATAALGIGNLLLIVLGFGVTIMPLIFAVNAMYCARAQITLNEQPIGRKAKKLANWTLGIAIVATIVLVVVAIVMLSGFIKKY